MKSVKPTTITRSIIHNKRIAPKGHVFLICKHTVAWSANQNKTFSLAVLVNTQGLTDEQEQILKNKLVEDFNKKLEAQAA